jgi:hypothetical protein
MLWAPLRAVNRTSVLCVKEGLSRKMPLDGATSNKGLPDSGYLLWAGYSKQKLYLQEDRAGRAAASDFHETATSLRHITPFLVIVPNLFWVRCRLWNKLERSDDLHL